MSTPTDLLNKILDAKTRVEATAMVPNFILTANDAAQRGQVIVLCHPLDFERLKAQLEKLP